MIEPQLVVPHPTRPEVTVVTVKCRDCTDLFSFPVPTEGWVAWRSQLKNIQVAMPKVPADKRELLISGICGRCFDEMFKGEED